MSNEVLKDSLESWAEKPKKDNLIKQFELRYAAHKKNANRYLGKDSAKLMFYLGKMRECNFIIKKLKQHEKSNL